MNTLIEDPDFEKKLSYYKTAVHVPTNRYVGIVAIGPAGGSVEDRKVLIRHLNGGVEKATVKDLTDWCL